MKTAWRVPTGTFAVSLALLLAAVAPASAAVVINEVDSDPADFVELYNNGAAAVNIGGYVLKDSNDNNTFAIPADTMIAAGGYYVTDLGGAFGLGAGDSARLYTPGDAPTLVDSVTWGGHAPFTYGRCPNGSGQMTATNSVTQGAANDCPAPALAWPGGSAISTSDEANMIGGDLSGLAYQPSGSGARGVLWAVSNEKLFRLIHNGTNWTPDPANGWSTGKQMVYPDGAGVPDSEGVTLVDGEPNAVYTASERNKGPVDISRPSVMRYDVSSAAVPLVATREWNLEADLPGLDANGGLEAVTWVPDDFLVAKGFLDEATGAAYAPATYPDHGAGLFFVGVEQTGQIVAYALDRSASTYTRVATIASGFTKIMGLDFERESTHLWAVCDNTCGGRSKTLDIAQSGAEDGRFVVTNTYERPLGMDILNNEGFAIAPQAECVGGFKPVIWADDSNTAGHALRTGTINCTVPKTTVVDPTPTATPQPTPSPTATPAPTVTPADVTAPDLKVAIGSTKRLRRTGKLGVTIKLSEPASLAFTATARKRAGSKARRILRTTRSVTAGRRTLRFTLSRRVRRALRRGETISLTVVARDAAGNATTRQANAKVR